MKRAKLDIQKLWALVRQSKNGRALPCLFATKQDAIENRDFDETLMPVWVHAANYRDIFKSRRRGDGSRKPSPAGQPGKDKTHA